MGQRILQLNTLNCFNRNIRVNPTPFYNAVIIKLACHRTSQDVPTNLSKQLKKSSSLL